VDWQKALSDALTPIIQAFVITVLGLLVAALKQFLKKQGLAIEAQEFAKEQTIATSAVLRAEEHVESMDAKPIDKSAAKLEHAVDVILAEAPKVSPEKAEALAKEAVARVGLGASGKAAAEKAVA
jgi:hypothetical protein